jgi:anti-sigma B factor antagonist
VLGSSEPADGTWSAALAVTPYRNGDKLVLELSGELDMDSSPALMRELDEALSGTAKQLVLDLSGLEFMDSTGLHLLVDTHRRCESTEIELRLVPGPSSVQRLFELTHTGSLFNFVE